MMSREDDGKDEHIHDLVMPGFRFYPTEEELIDFYLRRKVEGRRFNVELITFLNLYRYDPWELPALAAIGEKEWFFYVPRDRKYRNGDRPNRVTSSGYWKATGADRMIRGEDSRDIGLKKTLVFYSGKAPKGIRTAWIMNEYRLPHTDTNKYPKAEISLCRVYKRSGVDRQYQLPGTLSSNPSSSKLQTQPPSPPPPTPTPTPTPTRLPPSPAGESSSCPQSSRDKKQKLADNNNHFLYSTPITSKSNNTHDYMASSISTLEQLHRVYNQSYVLPSISAQNQELLIPSINPEDKLWEDLNHLMPEALKDYSTAASKIK